MIAIPPTICFRLTRRCNLRCPFCQAPPKEESCLSTEQIYAIIDKFQAAGMRSIKFTGGEPYVREDINGILLYCRNAGILPVVCTNGLLLHARNLEVLKETGAKVKVSLHGYKAHHNKLTLSHTYDDIAASIRRMRDYGIFVSLHTIATSDNVDSLPDFINQSASVGIRKISLIALISRGRQKEGAVPDLGIDALRIRHAQWRERFKDTVDLRLLDFAKDYYVLESDGSLWIERATEAADTLLCSDVLNAAAEFRIQAG